MSHAERSGGTEWGRDGGYGQKGLFPGEGRVQW